MIKSIVGDDIMSVKSKTVSGGVRPVLAALIAVLLVINFFVSYGNAKPSASAEEPAHHDSVKTSSSEESIPGDEGVHETARARLSVTGDVIIHNPLLKTATVSKNKYNFRHCSTNENS